MKLRHSKQLWPMVVKCDVHPRMKAHWLVTDHPYATTTNSDGEFKFEKLPAGEYTFVVWHERVGFITENLKATITARGTTELGKIKVPVARFRVKPEETVANVTTTASPTEAVNPVEAAATLQRHERQPFWR